MDLFGKKAQAENVELKERIEKLQELLDKERAKAWRLTELEGILAGKDAEYKISTNKLNKLLEVKTIEYTELYSKYKELENMNNCNLEAAQTLQKDLEDYANTIRLQCDRIDAISTEKADLELQIKSLVASNKAKQIEIDRLKEDKDGKLYLDREKEEIKKLEGIANNTKKGRIKSKNLKKSINIRKNAIDRVQE